MRIFLDTNVLVSAFASRGLCADLFELILLEHELVVGTQVLAELRRALRQKIKLPSARCDEIDEFLTRLYTRASPVNGARMAARAWTDPQYRDLLLSDGDAGAAEMGFGDLTYGLRIVPNTETTHNVIVCTLCSCYPVSLLGPSPGWYKSFAYRSRTVREPRAVLAECGSAATNYRRSAGEPCRRARLAQAACRRVLGLDDDFHLLHLRMPDDLVAGQYRAARYAGPRQGVEPLRSGAGHKCVLGQLQSCADVLLP